MSQGLRNQCIKVNDNFPIPEIICRDCSPGSCAAEAPSSVDVWSCEPEEKNHVNSFRVVAVENAFCLDKGRC